MGAEEKCAGDELSEGGSRRNKQSNPDLAKKMVGQRLKQEIEKQQRN